MTKWQIEKLRILQILFKNDSKSLTDFSFDHTENFVGMVRHPFRNWVNSRGGNVRYCWECQKWEEK